MNQDQQEKLIKWVETVALTIAQMTATIQSLEARVKTLEHTPHESVHV